MRNLKRALSLTLASVMLLGMMVLGTSAASYPDVTDEHNVEAIEVLQAVGVMTGSNSGNFNPDSKVSRIEMAIVMANLLNLNVDYFQGQNTFSDVPAWASGYVNACAASGIVTGVGGGRFGTGNVTATQAALMMLKALGYFQYASDFGTDWARATALQAAKINLFDGLNVQDNTQLTRNQVAQLALNALESTVMDAQDNTLHITTGEDAGNINISGGGVVYTARSSRQDYARAIDAKESQGNSSTSIAGWTIELGEQLYNGNLKKDDTVGDDFGRPAVQWTYKNDEIGTYATGARASFVGKVSRDTLYNTLGRSVVSGINGGNTAANTNGFANGLTGVGADSTPEMVVYYDGAPQASTSVDTYASRNDNTASGMSGNGVITEVFVDEYNNVIVAQHAIYVMQATNSYNSNKDTLSVTMRTRPSSAKNVTTLDGRDFDLTGFANEDYILYTYANSEVQSVTKAELLTGTVNSYSKKVTGTFGEAGGWVKLDDKEYKYAKYADVSPDNGCGVEYGVGQQAAVVLDGHDNVLWVDNKAISSGNYLYISEMATASRLGTTLIAEANFTDGTKAEITVERVNDNNSTHTNITSTVKTAATGGGCHSYDGWYSYSKNDNNEYTLTAASNAYVVSYLNAATTTGQKVVDNNKVNFLSAADTTNTTDNTSAKDSALLKVGAGSTAIRGNANTIFLVKDKDGDLKAYTGISNVPAITFSTVSNTTDTLDVVYMHTNDSATSRYASLVYIDAEKSSTIDDANNAYDLMFLLNGGETYRDGNDTYTRWKTVTNGEEKNDVESKSGAGLAKETMYYKVKADSKGYVKATPFPAPDAADDGAYKSGWLGDVSYNGESLVLGDDGAFIAPADAQYTLITYAPDMQKDDTADTDWEVYTGLTASSLANNLTAQKWALAGEWYAVTTSSTSDTLKSLYVVVRGTTEEMPESMSGNDIRALPDGVYTPSGSAFAAEIGGMTGAPEANIILKYTTKDGRTTTGSGETITLTIKNANGDTVYSENVTDSTWAANSGHYFCLYKWCDSNTTVTPGWDATNGRKPASGVGTKGVNGLIPGATYTYTIVDGGETVASDSFIA